MYSFLRHTLVSLFLSVAATAQTAAVSVPPLSGPLGQPVELFNGKDFTGWVWFARPPKPDTNTPAATLAEVFSIQDGILRSKGKPTGYLRTEGEFKNFILTVEQRHVTAGNGGLLVGIPAQDKVWPGLEIQTRTDSAGDLWNHNLLKLEADPARVQNNGKHIKRIGPDSQKPVGEWETMEVIVDSGNLVFKVNGVVQNVATNTESLAGRIGLQAEGAGMEFRKVQITPIGSAK